MRANIVVLIAGMLLAGSANADTITQTVDNIDWNLVMWGTPAAAPTTGNDYIVDSGTVRIQADDGSGTFGGDSLTINSGATALSKMSGSNVATVNGTFTLNGGAINIGPNSGGTGATLATGGFVVGADSEIYINNAPDGFFITGGLSGSGDLLLSSAYPDAGGRFISFDSAEAYTGTIAVTENITLDFGSDMTFGGSLAIDAVSQLNVDQALTFAAGTLTFNGTAIAVGTYTGPALDSLITSLGEEGFINDGGTLNVGIHHQTVDNIDWNAVMWGTPAAAPTTGNDYVTAGANQFRIQAGLGSGSFLGDGSITVVSGTAALIKLADGNTATMSGQFILDGGTLFHGPNAGSTATFATGGLVVNSSSTVSGGQASTALTITGGLSGAGNLSIEFANPGINNGGKIISFDSANAYTGTMSVSEKMTLDFGSDVDFGGNLAIASNSFLNVDQAITFASGALTFDGTAIAAGTYTGTGITGLGTGFLDGGGTLVITASKYAETRFNFDTGHDYLVDGVAGTGWDGMLKPTTTVFNSATANAGKLTITSTGTWGGTTAMNTPFLYVNVTGDFVATTVIATADVANYHTVGMAAVDPGNTDSLVTAQASFSGSLRHMAWNTTDGSRAQAEVSASLGDLNYYQIERSGDTFTSRYSFNTGSTWIDIASYTRADLASTLQVGVFHSAGGASSPVAQFESFTLQQEPPKGTVILIQ